MVDLLGILRGRFRASAVDIVSPFLVAEWESGGPRFSRNELCCTIQNLAGGCYHRQRLFIPVGGAIGCTVKGLLQSALDVSHCVTLSRKAPVPSDAVLLTMIR